MFACDYHNKHSHELESITNRLENRGGDSVHSHGEAGADSHHHHHEGGGYTDVTGEEFEVHDDIHGHDHDHRESFHKYSPTKKQKAEDLKSSIISD